MKNKWIFGVAGTIIFLIILGSLGNSSKTSNNSQMPLPQETAEKIIKTEVPKETLTDNSRGKEAIPLEANESEKTETQEEAKQETPKEENTKTQTTDANTPKASTESKYVCGSKTKCGEMASCEEAYFYLKDCGVIRLDGDKDGVPCESICD